MEKSDRKFSVKSRLNSFTYAFDGFKIFLKHEHNARIHLVFTAFAMVMGIILKISTMEWALVVFAIGFVFVTEILNTCIEEVCDFICAEENSKIKKIKDLAALAVLFSVISAVIVGLVIFVPKML